MVFLPLILINFLLLHKQGEKIMKEGVDILLHLLLIMSCDIISKAPAAAVYVTGFWKTDHFVTFDIIYISIYLRHSRWYNWFNNWLNQSHAT